MLNKICIKTRDSKFYVDNCKENWDILKNLNNKTLGFIYLKTTSGYEQEDEILGIRVDEILAFHSA